MRVEAGEAEAHYERHRDSLGGRLCDYYTALYISQNQRVPLEAAFPWVAFGGNDWGIDAAWIDAGKGICHFWQVQAPGDPPAYPTKWIRFISRGYDSLSAPKTATRPDPFLTRLRRDWSHPANRLEALRLHLVLPTGGPDPAEDPLFAALREHLEQKAAPLRLEVLIESHEESPTPASEQANLNVPYDLPYQGVLLEDSPQDLPVFTGFAPLAALCRIHSAMKGRLFDEAIRYGLPTSTLPHRAIRDTLASILFSRTEEPGAFAARHQGITLSASQAEWHGGMLRLWEPRLIAGAQTVAAASQIFAEQASRLESLELALRLESVMVTVSVLAGKSSELAKAKIARNTNHRVEPWQLRMNDDIQSALAGKFRADAGIYYARHTGSLDPAYMERVGFISASRTLRPLRLARTILASRGNLEFMRRMRAVFGRDDLYDRAFDRILLQTNVRAIILAYKMQFRIAALTRATLGVTRPALLRASRDLYWALLIQALFHNPGLAGLVNQFGQTATPEPDYLAWMRETTVQLVQPLIAEVVADPRFEHSYAAAEYGFLQKQSFYRECMTVANRLYGWTPRPFPSDHEIKGLPAS